LLLTANSSDDDLRALSRVVLLLPPGNRQNIVKGFE